MKNYIRARLAIVYLLIIALSTPLFSQPHEQAEGTQESRFSCSWFLGGIGAGAVAYFFVKAVAPYQNPVERRDAIRKFWGALAGLGGAGRLAPQGAQKYELIPVIWDPHFKFDHHSAKSKRILNGYFSDIKNALKTGEGHVDTMFVRGEELLTKLAKQKGMAFQIALSKMKKEKFQTTTELDAVSRLIDILVRRVRASLSLLENNDLSIEERLNREGQIESIAIYGPEEALLRRIMELRRDLLSLEAVQLRLRKPNHLTALGLYFLAKSQIRMAVDIVRNNSFANLSEVAIIGERRSLTSLQIYLKIAQMLHSHVVDVLKRLCGGDPAQTLIADLKPLEETAQEMLKERTLQFSLAEKLRELEESYWKRTAPSDANIENEKAVKDSHLYESPSTKLGKVVKGKVKKEDHTYDLAFEHTSKTKKKKMPKKSNKVREVLTPDQAKDVIAKLKKIGAVFDDLFASSHLMITHHQVVNLAEHVAAAMAELGIASAQEFYDGVAAHVHPNHGTSDGELCPSNYLDILRMRFVVFGIFPQDWEPQTIEDFTAYDIYLQQYELDL